MPRRTAGGARQDCGRNKFWTCGWHAPAQLERVFLGHLSHPSTHGQTSLTVPPLQLPLFCPTHTAGKHGASRPQRANARRLRKKAALCARPCRVPPGNELSGFPDLGRKSRQGLRREDGACGQTPGFRATMTSPQSHRRSVVSNSRSCAANACAAHKSTMSRPKSWYARAPFSRRGSP